MHLGFCLCKNEPKPRGKNATRKLNRFIWNNLAKSEFVNVK